MTTSAVGSRVGDAHKSNIIKIITVGKSVLFNSTIYILCTVMAWRSAAVVVVGKGMTTEEKGN